MLELHRALCSGHPRSLARPLFLTQTNTSWGEGRGRRDSVGKAMSANCLLDFRRNSPRSRRATPFPTPQAAFPTRGNSRRPRRRRRATEEKERKAKGRQAAAPHTCPDLGSFRPMRGADPSAALTPPLPSIAELGNSRSARMETVMAANSDSSEYGDGRGNRGAQRAERLAGAGLAHVPGRPHGEGGPPNHPPPPPPVGAREGLFARRATPVPALSLWAEASNSPQRSAIPSRGRR